LVRAVEVAKDAVKVFYKRVLDARTERTRMLFDDWRRVFSQVCAYSPEKIKGLEEVYGIVKRIRLIMRLCFLLVHTYYALGHEAFSG
jgi:hypothetical protein